MVKKAIKYICQKCEYESASWLGKCPNCGEWNSLVETIVSTKLKTQNSKLKTAKPVRLSEIKKSQLKRISTGISEFDRVLGGGIVPGSVILLAGEPGVGKSTIMLQMTEALNSKLKTQNSKLLYVSGEESAEQLKLRASRLGIKGENLIVLEETNVEGIIEEIEKLRHYSSSESRHYVEDESRSYGSRQARTITKDVNLIIIDSIQTLYSEELTGIPGSIGQVRACGQKLFDISKEIRIPMFFIGHITKEGTIAGPKTIEHLVDTVLYLEGERNSSLRILRSFKNRFGPTDEVGVFQMEEGGLEEVKNPSQFFLGKKEIKPPGAAITVALQGTRPILAEVESLVVPTKLAFPRRVTSGVSFSKLQIISAVLLKLIRLPLGGFDIYTSISGGLKVTEPAIDLAMALSIISSFKNKPLPVKTAVIGELGLLGEIRPVPLLERREKEARKLGFKNILSAKNYKNLSDLVKILWF